jgi:hypothetical protein
LEKFLMIKVDELERHEDIIRQTGNGGRKIAKCWRSKSQTRTWDSIGREDYLYWISCCLF